MKKLTEYSIVELKALVYDQIAIVEKAQSLIKIVNEEIMKRSKVESKDE